jgi:ribonuclease-3
MRAAADGGLAALEKRLHYRFKNRELIRTALTHSSSSGTRVNYQRHEFLGDRVLGLVIAEMLLTAYPTAPEGDLSRRLAELVRRETCADVAAAIDLGSALRFANGRTSRAALLTTNVMGDACEALIAALYEDGGLEAARKFIATHWSQRLNAAALSGRNAKAALQEWAQGRGLDVPAYSIAGKSGPDHDPRFEVEVRVADLAAARGEGRTRREAEQAAAALLLTREGVWSAKP